LASRTIGYLAGCDSCSALATTDSQNDIYINLIDNMQAMSVTCISDAGAPKVNIQRNSGGTVTNLLSSNLTCSSSGATTTAFTSSPFMINVNDRLNLVVASVDGTAHRATIFIKAVLQ
jgi:hypothetical protein